jgi:ribosomal protein S21
MLILVRQDLPAPLALKQALRRLRKSVEREEILREVRRRAFARSRGERRRWKQTRAARSRAREQAAAP